MSTSRLGNSRIKLKSSTQLCPMSSALRFLQKRSLEKFFSLWIGSGLCPCRVEKAVTSVRTLWSPTHSVQPKKICG